MAVRIFASGSCVMRLRRPPPPRNSAQGQIHTDKLKAWITDPRIPCEGKYDDAEEIENNFNLVLTSNDERPVIIEKGDRRYSVFQSTVVPNEVIQPVRADLAGARAEVTAFYDALLNRKVKLKYGDLYKTVARTEVQLASASTSERFAAAIKEDGFLSVAAGWVDGAPYGVTREPTVSDGTDFYVLSETLMGVYRQFCIGIGGQLQHVRAVTQALLAVFKGAEPSLPIRVGSIQRRAWRGLPLEPPPAVVAGVPVSPASAK